MYNIYGMNQCPLFNRSQTYGMESFCNSCSSYPYCTNTQMYGQSYNPVYNPAYSNINSHVQPQNMQQQLPWQYGQYNGKVKGNGDPVLKDYGPEPFTINIEEATKHNENFRTALWTGKHLQLTLMSIGVGEDIGLEIHPELDQFLRVEEGRGLVKMGDSRDKLDYQRMVNENYAFIVPAGKWHNLINTGDTPLKLYSIYAPSQHPHGTVHKTKADAQAAEAHHHH